MPEHVMAGAPAAPGIGLGRAWRPQLGSGGGPAGAPEDERRSALAALEGAVVELESLAAGLPAPEAEIVETGALMGQDRALIAAVEQGTSEGLSAADAIRSATEAHARAIEAIGDEYLAARGEDVRSLGRRAARLASGGPADRPPADGLVLVAEDLGPGDVAEFAPALVAVALSGGGATAHAAIVARSLGLPMVTGLGAPVLAVADGTELVVDGSSGTVTVDAAPRLRLAANSDMAERHEAQRRAHDARDEPAVTTDGSRVTVLANVASPEELMLALAAGAEGVGLLRTELAFLEAADWPEEQEHADVLRRILDGLGPHPAVVRVLDFGADKTPPFLRGVPDRGLGLLLAHPDALAAQLRAIAEFPADVRILLPMVESASQVVAVRELLGASTPLGAMIETPAAARDARAIASVSDFLSIGTNDLTSATLGADRFRSDGAPASDPKVLRAVASSVAAAHEAGIPIEVCGEAASDPIMLPLLVGLGVDELSIGAARVGPVRAWIRALHAGELTGLARSALTMDSSEEVQWAVRPVAEAMRAAIQAPAGRVATR